MIIEGSKLVIVMPVYEDAEASGRLFRELVAQFESEVHVIVVDDGSVRRPLALSDLDDTGIAGHLLRLRRNVGHQRAIAIGLGFASEHIGPQARIVVMDSDGEDLPSTIPALLETLADKPIDVVVAERRSRVETLRFKLFYMLYRRLFGLLTGRSISFGNFMAMKPHAVRRLVSMQELSIHVAGTVLASKLRIATRPLDRGPRYAGKSKMNFVGLALHGFKALMIFAEDVLVRVGIACALIGTLSLLGAAAAILLKLLGFSTPGWFSVALGILVLILLQTGALTLMTLMLTGVVRGGNVATTLSYNEFVDEVLATGPST